MADAKRIKPGIKPKKKGLPKIKKIRPLSPAEFADLCKGVQRELTYGQKALLWLGAKFIGLGLFLYRLTD